MTPETMTAEGRRNVNPDPAFWKKALAAESVAHDEDGT